MPGAWRLLAGLACVVCAAASALADGAPTVDEYQLPAVVVEGEHTLQELDHDRTAAGTVVEGAALERAGQALSDVVDAQPGVRVQRLGGPGTPSTLSIRGSTPEQVLVTLDGIPLNLSAGGAVDLSRLPIGNLSRVEVYRGVSPVAFGSSAIGGVLALESRSGGERRLDAEARLGSWWERGARVFGAVPFGRGDVAVGLDYAGARGDFSYVNDGGTRFDTSDDREVRRRNAEFDQVGVLAKGRLFLGDHAALTVLDWAFWRDQGLPGLGLYDTRSSRLVAFENLSAVRLEAVGLADDRLDADVVASFRLVDTRFSDPLSEIGLRADDSHDRALVPDVRGGATVRLLPLWDLRVVAGYRHERFEPSEGGSSLPTSARNAGFVALESGLTVAPLGLLIVPAGRFEGASSRIADRTADDAAVASHDDRIATWRLSLAQQAGRDTQLTLAGGSATRFPSLFELFGNTGAVVDNPALVPESSLGVEAGVIHAAGWLPTPHRLRLAVAGHLTRVTDLIQFVQTAQNVSVAQNLGAARLLGLEADLRADLFAHWRSDASLSLLRAVDASDVAARSGNALPLRPAWRWHARTEGYTGRHAWLYDAVVGVQVEQTAGDYLDPANLVWLRPRLAVDLDLSVTLVPQRLRVAVACRNLLDQQAQDLVGHPVPGRSFHVAVSGSLSP